MTKKEVIWLLIRIAGLYFVWQGIESSIALLANLMTMGNAPELIPKSGGVIVQSILLMMLYAGLGLYMMSNGGFFYQVLSRQSDSDR
jgi:hypothetical protein